jgi:hypothetical protein
MSWNRDYLANTVFLTSFQRKIKRKAVLICQEDHINYVWEYGPWGRKELKKGINFYCPCVLMNNRMFKRMIQTQTYSKNHFKIIHMDDDYVFLCQTRSDVQDETIPWPFHLEHKPTSLQFQCVATIVAHNLVQKAKIHLPKGIIQVLNEFTETQKLPFTTRVTYSDDISYKCRNKRHRFNLVRNLKPNNWNENLYDLTEDFKCLGF